LADLLFLDPGEKNFRNNILLSGTRHSSKRLIHIVLFGYFVADWFTTGCSALQEENRPKEALMASMRSDRARARARDLLATVYPIPNDAEFRRLRELAIDYIEEAERLDAENRGRVLESDELISTALDAVARDFFARALLRAVSHRTR
jgi:hypothetical protein